MFILWPNHYPKGNPSSTTVVRGNKEHIFRNHSLIDPNTSQVLVLKKRRQISSFVKVGLNRGSRIFRKTKSRKRLQDFLTFGVKRNQLGGKD